MEFIVAKSGGFCHGVKKAVDTALSVSPENTYIYGEIIHNPDVVKQIMDRGIKTVDSLEEVPDNATLIIRSHGVGRGIYEICQRRNIKIIDCTCEFVRRTQKIVDEKNGGKPIKVVANLPYYITTPIIMGLFESHLPLKSITIMVQKEVADRMQVGPGTKDYGALSLAVQYYAKPEIVANVPPNCFMPRPNVGSAVIRLTKYENPPVFVENEEFMFSLIRATFNQRRKTLVNAIGNASNLNISKEMVTEVLSEMGESATVRGETFSLEKFADFTNKISKKLG